MLCKQPYFLSDGIQFNEILPQEKMEPFPILGFVFWEYAQQIAVMKIQCPEAGDLLCFPEAAPVTAILPFRWGFWKWPLRSALLKDSGSDTGDGIFFTEVSDQSDE